MQENNTNHLPISSNLEERIESKINNYRSRIDRLSSNLDIPFEELIEVSQFLFSVAQREADQANWGPVEKFLELERKKFLQSEDSISFFKTIKIALICLENKYELRLEHGVHAFSKKAAYLDSLRGTLPSVGGFFSVLSQRLRIEKMREFERRLEVIGNGLESLERQVNNSTIFEYLRPRTSSK